MYDRHVTILVDIEERRSSVPAHLGRLGVAFDFVTLPHCDYLTENGAAVERKTVADFHRSVATARIWSQVAGLARFDRAYLLVEGQDLDAGLLSSAGIRGAVLQVADNDIAVLRSTSARDTALWLRLLSARGERRGRLLGRRGRRRVEPSPIGLLSAIPGISPSLAEALLERFGSIAELTAATPTELRSIRGIGPGRAAALQRALLDTYPRSG